MSGRLLKVNVIAAPVLNDAVLAIVLADSPTKLALPVVKPVRLGYNVLKIAS